MTTMLPSTLIKLQRVLTTSTTKITKRNCTILLQHHKLTKFNNNSKKHVGGIINMYNINNNNHRFFSSSASTSKDKDSKIKGGYEPGSEMTPTTTEQLLDNFEDSAKERDVLLRADHHALKTEFPEHSLPPGETTVSEDAAYKKRLIYRSKQRGWLEVDLLLGTWASENVMNLNKMQLEQYEMILNQETLDIYNFIIERDDVPKELENEVMDMLREFAMEKGVVPTPMDYEKNMKSKMSN